MTNPMTRKKPARQEGMALLALLGSLMLSSLIFIIVVLIQGQGAVLVSTGISQGAGPARMRVNGTRTAMSIVNSISIEVSEAEDTVASRAYRELIVQEEAEKDKPLTFQTVGSDYFEDALFIGDSRTVGLRDYAPFENAVYFATEGTGTYSVMDDIVDIPGLGEIGLEELFKKRTFGKVYLMLGLNELYLEPENVAGRYDRLVKQIRDMAPDAIIFLQANLYVTYSYEAYNPDFNNESIRYLNERAAALANGKDIFYVDVNPLFTDDSGYLIEDYTGDGAHVYGKLYQEWAEWLKTKGIVKEKKELIFNEGS